MTRETLSEKRERLSAMLRSIESFEELEAMGVLAELDTLPENVALKSARQSEAQRRKELSLQDPYFSKTMTWPTRPVTDEDWYKQVESWIPPDWEDRVASGEFNTPSLPQS